MADDNPTMLMDGRVNKARGEDRRLRQCAAMTPEEVRLDLAGPMSSRWFVSLHCARVRSQAGMRPEQSAEKGVVR